MCIFVISFAVNGPTTWNSLPPALRAPELSQNAFTRALKTNLFSSARHRWDFLRYSSIKYKYTDRLTYLTNYWDRWKVHGCLDAVSNRYFERHRCIMNASGLCRFSGMPRLAWQLALTSTLLDVIQLVCHIQTLKQISTTQHTAPRYIAMNWLHFLSYLFHFVVGMNSLSC